MKFYILFFSLVNGIIGTVVNQPSKFYGNCDVWGPLIKSTGFDIGTDCCNVEGIECQDSKVMSIDITVDSGVIDMTKLPLSVNLEKFSIKGDIYQGVFPIQLLDSEMIKILDLSNSSIKEIPEDIEENNTIEEIYLNNNQLQIFPYQFSEINNLKVLNLDNNNIDDSISNYLDELSLNDNSLSDMQYIENVKDFSNIDDTVIFYDDDDDDDGAVLAMVIIIFCFLFFIPTALILSTYNDTSSHEAYLNLRNQIHAQYQNYEQLPDYNEVIADSQQGLPGYDYQEDSDYQQNIPIIDSQRDLPNYGSQQDLPPPNYESQEDTLNYESQEDTSNYDAPPDYEEIVS